MSIGISIKEYLTIQTSHCEDELSKLENASIFWESATANLWGKFSDTKRATKCIFIAWCTIGKSGFERRQYIEQLLGQESKALSMQPLSNQAVASCFTLYLKGSSAKDMLGQNGIRWQPILPMMKVRKGALQRLENCEGKSISLTINSVSEGSSVKSQMESFLGLNKDEILKNMQDTFPHTAAPISNDLVDSFHSMLNSCQTQGMSVHVPDVSFTLMIALIANFSVLEEVISIDVTSPIQLF